MVTGPHLYLILIFGVVFIVIATVKFKLHPFLALLLASFGVGITAGVPLVDIVTAVNEGFGGIMGHIGIVIVSGTIIGKILEKSGAAFRMAEVVLKVTGEKKPQLGMSLIGALVSIPVFCDSAFVILSSLKKSIAIRTKVSQASMSIALATGLYATHTLIPPTPGPIAAAGNLGAADYLGTVILMGLIVAVPTIFAGYFWALKMADKISVVTDNESDLKYAEIFKDWGDLPSSAKAFLPIFLPIFLIGIGSVLRYLETSGTLSDLFVFIGTPTIALIIGIFSAFPLLPALNETTLTGWIGEGLADSAIILLLTGAGGAFGAVIKETAIAETVTSLAESGTLEGAWILLIPFLIAAALKTAQGSSTASIVITSALLAPSLHQAGITEAVPLSLMVMAIGAGAMAVSHVNDSYFWVVTQFSGIKLADGYRAHTLATLVQGLTAIAVTVLLWILLV